jgi:predicted ferric reductase
VVTLFLHSVFSAVFVTAWWALDLLIRYAVLAGMRNRTTAELRIIGARKRHDIQPHEPAVELLVQKPLGFSYNAGQFVRIVIPAISAVEVHPISISSAPYEEDVLTLHVRRLGDWSDKLVALAEKETTTTVLIEGPYGAMSVGLEDDTKYKRSSV